MACMGFLITIFALCVVICVHELGHMIAALRSGIAVYEFSIGMGPTLFSKKYKDTLYSFRLFPLGGFVKIAGLNDEEGKPAPLEVSYLTKPLFSRVWVIIAGPLMNFLFGFLVFFIIFFLWGSKEVLPVIDKVVPHSPAEQVGLLAQDHIISFNHHPVKDIVQDFMLPLSKSGLNPIILHLRRNQEDVVLTITPTLNAAKKPVIGIMFKQEYSSQSLISSFVMAGQATYAYTKMVFVSFKLLFSGSASLKELSGPIGIVQFASNELNRSFPAFLHIIGVISVSIAVINLLPFPILDGGHLLFLGIQAIRKKPLTSKTEAFIGNIAAVFLISLMLLAIFNDVLNWKSRQLILNNFQKK